MYMQSFFLQYLVLECVLLKHIRSGYAEIKVVQNLEHFSSEKFKEVCN